MGWMVMAGIPLFLLLLLEVTLRVTGFGHPTRFFIDDPEGDGTSLVTNHRFTHRFFPPALARGIIPYRLSRDKPDGVYRIFVFGESAANGDPEPAFGFSRYLELLLESRFPGTDFEIICTAITAINSHVILPIARDSAAIEADLWIVYMGNNEVIGPYGPGTVFGSQAPPLPVIRAHQFVTSTRIGQLIETVLTALREPDPLGEWEGIDMFTENLLRADSPVRTRVIETFKTNLDAILAEARDAGVPVLLSTVASNLRDCGPFASVVASDLQEAEAEALQAANRTGIALMEGGAFARGLASFEKALERDDGYAGSHFLIGKALLALGQRPEADAALQRARDRDALAVRADNRLNDSIRKAAAERQAAEVTLVDSEAAFARAADDGIPGREFFFEHVHFTPAGNDLLARAFAEEVLGRLPESILASDTGAWPSPGNLRIQLGMTLWDQHRLWMEMAERLDTPPYDQRLLAAEAVALCRQQAAWLQPRIRPELDRQVYERALEARPHDYHILTRYGYFLLHEEDFDEAIKAFSKVRDQFPHFDGGHQDLGLALLLAGRLEEARAAFERVLEIRPGYPRALKALDLVAEQADSR